MNDSLGIPRDTRAPAWVSEIYQLLSLVIGSVLLIFSQVAGPWPLVFYLYRTLDILLLYLQWILQASHVFARRRRLVGFMVNLVEINIYFAGAYIALGCLTCGEKAVISGQRVVTAIYNSVRISLTIGPTDPRECCRQY